MKHLLIIFLVISQLWNLSAQQEQSLSARNSMTVVFYNVENLFDTSDDPGAVDEEFLPTSLKQWNDERYKKKISDLGDVLTSINDKELPALIGLCEIENYKVLNDLASGQKLRRARYGIVHADSPDERGIDVALLYDPDEIEMIDSRPIQVSLGKDSEDKTRDILYAKCRIKGDRILHVFVNHWPSRSPNQEDSESKRIMAALTLRKQIDLILNNENDAAILVMGDFNDEPTNRSVMQILNATNKMKNQHYRDLYNLMYDPHNAKGEGSITFKENWQMFDQIIVSQSLLVKGSNFYALPSDGKVFKNEKVIAKDPVTGKSLIYRTYQGDNYTGGVSDHLPVFIVLRKEGR